MHIGTRPKVFFFDIIGRENLGLRGPVRHEILLGIIQDGNIPAPENIAQGILFLGLNPLHGFSSS